MLSDKPGKSRKDQQPSDKSEIITPIKVRSQSSRPETSGTLRISIRPLLVLFMVMGALAAGGIIFISHVSKHPVDLSDGTDRIAKEEIEISGTQITDSEGKTEQEADSAESQPEAPPDEQLADDFLQGTGPEEEIVEREQDENLDAVSRLIESGRNHEKEGRFAFAHTDYQEALKSDPDSGEARESLRRVKERIIDDQFQKLISDGLAAYHKGEYQSAGELLLKAKSFRPDSPEVQSALMQVNEAVRLESIEKLRQKAKAGEQAENWEQALKSYAAVLEIDPNITFAVQGKERSLDQIRINRRITYFLQKPGALESDEQLQNAILLNEEARNLQPRGPRLNEHINDFTALLDAARTPVQVSIESDNLTEVAVYRVGRLGSFVTHELSLRPGTYTVVGSRDGYRDVRQEIVVKPGQKALRVTVICRDKV